MKLSEAIRKGAEIVPCQARHTMAIRNPLEGKVLGVCALGAAVVGVLGEEGVSSRSDATLQAVLQDHFKLEELTVHAPDGPERSPCDVSIAYLNDTAKWTFEQIATWLEEQGL